MAELTVEFRKFTSEEMKSIYDNYKIEEYSERLSKKEILIVDNVIYKSKSFLNSNGDYQPHEVFIYSYFRCENGEINVSEELIRSQLIIRIISANLHIGIYPFVDFVVNIEKYPSGTNCIIQAIHYGDGFCPFIDYFASKINLIKEYINEIIKGENKSLELDSVKEFISLGNDNGYYNNSEDDDEVNDYGLVIYDEDGEIDQDNSDFDYLMELQNYENEVKIDSFYRYANLQPLFNSERP